MGRLTHIEAFAIRASIIRQTGSVATAPAVLPSCCWPIVKHWKKVGLRCHFGGVSDPEAERIVASVAV